jgi:hypothetical protein
VLKNLWVQVYGSQRVEDSLLIYPPLTKGRGGGVLEEDNKRDKDKQTIMEAIGITFLRFSNREIYENINGVLNKISGYIKTQESHTPPLSSPWKEED